MILFALSKHWEACYPVFRAKKWQKMGFFAGFEGLWGLPPCRLWQTVAEDMTANAVSVPLAQQLSRTSAKKLYEHNYDFFVLARSVHNKKTSENFSSMTVLSLLCLPMSNGKIAKLFLFFTVTFALVVWPLIAHTTTYILEDEPGTGILVNPTYTHLFDFTPLITNPAAVIYSATLYVYVHDDNERSADRITLTADGTVILHNFRLTNEGSDTLGPFDVLMYVADDKQMLLSVQAAAGDFFYDRSTLSVTTSTSPISSTWFLLGTGLLGLAALRRRRKSG